MRVQLFNTMHMFDDSPFIGKAVQVDPNGYASVTLSILHILREEEFGVLVRVRVQGSNDAENWSTIETLDFSALPAETLTMHELITTTYIRPIVFLLQATELIATAEADFAMA